MNLARHFDRSKVWDFTFLRWLAPDLLDGFSIGRYEEKLNPSTLRLYSTGEVIQRIFNVDL